MRRLWVGAVCLSGSVLFWGACGSGRSSTTGSLRFMQASATSPAVNVLVDGANQASNLNYGNATAYLTVKTGSRHVQAVPVNGSSQAIFDQTVSVNSSPKVTVLMTGSSGAIQSVVLSDANTTAVTGDGHVRVVNASSNMGAADIYIVPAGASITGVTPVASALAIDKDTGYQAVVAGNIEILMTIPGTSNALVDTGPINLKASDNQTVIALDNPSGGATFTVLADQ